MEEFLNKLENKKDWETLTINEVNKYKGVKREALLNYYHSWLWTKRKKPIKAKKCRRQGRKLLNT